MLEPTSGSVTIEGMDHRMHIQDVRKILGFCPQYGKIEISDKDIHCLYVILDILYDELSVVEHLELFGKVFRRGTDAELVKPKNRRK
jgi:ABC-type multidrug transport system ATPase subunit